MNRLSTIVWLFALVVAVFMLYKVKYQVQAIKQEVASVTQELQHEREAMRVINAEWAYLNRPVRLQQLAQKYLASTDVTVHQIAEIHEIPFPEIQVAKADIQAEKFGVIMPASVVSTTMKTAALSGGVR